MPETRACPIWQTWMRDYREAIGRARAEWRENAEYFRQVAAGRNGRR